MSPKNGDPTRRHGETGRMPTSPSPANIPPNRQRQVNIGNYRVLNKLGQGEFGLVYKVKSRHGSQDGEAKFYALKVLHEHYSKADYRRLRSEAKLLQKLSHPSLPRFIETGVCAQGEFAGRPYLVMEFIEGRNLKEYLKSDQVRVDTALRWIHDLCEGLAYLHSNSVIHRDLKPSNIQVAWDTRHGRSLRLLDFGIAILRSPRVAALQEGPEIIGTLKYMSPEQFRGERLTPAADIYALGLILYELLNGRYPYDATGTDFAEWRQIHAQAVPPPLHLPHVPAAISDMVISCLAKKASARPTAEQLREIVAQEVSGIGLPSYIAILGHRASGKTCYLTSLAHDATLSPETRELLEDKYVALYEEGELPAATALAAQRLNFGITDTGTGKYYDIVTKDYGGELLAGRRLKSEEKAENEAADKELLEKKREEVYEFFQNARAILIMVETRNEAWGLGEALDHRYEVESLIERISQTQGGQLQIRVPVALVLTKWDRISGPVTPEQAAAQKERAYEYVEQTGWLNNLHTKLQMICRAYEIFPVYSFIGDKPNVADVRPFNILAPLIWASEQSQVAMLQQVEQMEAEQDTKKTQVLEAYWRLLHIEKLNDANIQNQIKSRMKALSQACLAETRKQAQGAGRDWRYVIGLYRQLLRTPGLQTAESEVAERELQICQRAQRKQHYSWMLIGLLLFLGLTYFAWEFRRYTHLQQVLTSFEHGGQENLLASWHDYQSLRYVSITYLLQPGLEKRVCNLLARRLQKEIEFIRDYTQEKLPPAPSVLQQFEQLDHHIIQKNLESAQCKIALYDLHISRLEEFRDNQEKWRHELHLLAKQDFSLPYFSVADKLKEWEQGRIAWMRYATALNSRNAFWKLEHLRTDIQNAVCQSVSPSNWRTQAKHVSELIDQLQHWQLPNSDLLSVEDARKLRHYRDKYYREFAVYQKCSDLASFCTEIIKQYYKPAENDSYALLKNKERKLQYYHDQLKQVIDRLDSTFPQGFARLYQQRCAEWLRQVDQQLKHCSFFKLKYHFQEVAQQQFNIVRRDTPTSLRHKIHQIDRLLTKLKQAPPSDLLAHDAAKLEAQCARLIRKFSQQKIKIANKLKLLQKLEQQCEHWQDHWQAEVSKRSSYTACQVAMQDLLKSISAWQYLQDLYEAKLKQILQDLHKMKAADYHDFRKIALLVQQQRFIQALREFIKYSKQKQHVHIRTQALASYFTNLKVQVTVHLAVDASHLSDPGSDYPDVSLYIKGFRANTLVHKNKQEQSDQLDWNVTDVFSQRLYHADSNYWSEDFTMTMELGKYDAASYVELVLYILEIHVTEIDPFANDSYGSFKVQASNFLDNEKVSKTHQCGSDGSITVTLTPEITLDSEQPFPTFEE